MTVRSSSFGEVNNFKSILKNLDFDKQRLKKELIKDHDENSLKILEAYKAARQKLRDQFKRLQRENRNRAKKRHKMICSLEKAKRAMKRSYAEATETCDAEAEKMEDLFGENWANYCEEILAPDGRTFVAEECSPTLGFFERTSAMKDLWTTEDSEEMENVYMRNRKAPPGFAKKINEEEQVSVDESSTCDTKDEITRSPLRSIDTNEKLTVSLTRKTPSLPPGFENSSLENHSEEEPDENTPSTNPEDIIRKIIIEKTTTPSRSTLKAPPGLSKPFYNRGSLPSTPKFLKEVSKRTPPGLSVDATEKDEEDTAPSTFTPPSFLQPIASAVPMFGQQMNPLFGTFGSFTNFASTPMLPSYVDPSTAFNLYNQLGAKSSEKDSEPDPITCQWNALATDQGMSENASNAPESGIETLPASNLETSASLTVTPETKEERTASRLTNNSIETDLNPNAPEFKL
ncbi:Oidioi.mRNA.OKI2018_I69.PAR.g10391.t1.cds [Oikopleura dioica]|uniref:Oidioi.mRNA.OKI2018_I69.PAR.g10391.t1.cds n=1 Tax=Oikopleura dioica TaxID=34765 RepID=A0ABN7RUM8_OIKDI|nr:Oidioi.mRNA.OKI2018_I69.PAR.g10391.t1.cds [Oikopleura dioica]